MEMLKQKLSDIYVTLEDIEIKGKFTKPYAICMQTLEECITEIANMISANQSEEVKSE